MKHFAIILLPALLLVVLQRISIEQPLKPGDVVPAKILHTAVVENLTLRDFCTPRAVVVFMSAGCRRCTSELMNIKELQSSFGSSIRFLLVSSGKRPAVQSILDSLGLAIPLAIDANGELRRAFGAYTVPSVFLIDSTGRIWQTSFSEHPLEVRRQQLEEFVRSVTLPAALSHNP